MSNDDAQGSRAELKRLFSKGLTPTQGDFHLLIDAVFNHNDDFITCLEDGGIKVFAKEGAGTFIAMQVGRVDASANWVIAQEEGSAGGSALSLRYKLAREVGRQSPPAPLMVQDGGQVGINCDAPRWELEVGGAVGMQARVGTHLQGTVPADGGWHNILGEIKEPAPLGYYGLEVMAYVKPPQLTGRYGITHAICMGAYPSGNHPILEFLGFHNQRGIRLTQGYWGTMRHRIDLRWGGTQAAPQLEMRTRKRLQNCQIYYNVTNLLPKIAASSNR
jgi:hypothetical protein